MNVYLLPICVEPNRVYSMNDAHEFTVLTCCSPNCVPKQDIYAYYSESLHWDWTNFIFYPSDSEATWWVCLKRPWPSLTEINKAKRMYLFTSWFVLRARGPLFTAAIRCTDVAYATLSNDITWRVFPGNFSKVNMILAKIIPLIRSSVMVKHRDWFEYLLRLGSNYCTNATKRQHGIVQNVTSNIEDRHK